MNATCQKQMYARMGISLGLCGKRAKVRYERKHYCGQHDPVRRHERAQARSKHVSREIAAEMEMTEIHSEIDALVERHTAFKGLRKKRTAVSRRLHRLYEGRTKVGLPRKGLRL